MFWIPLAAALAVGQADEPAPARPEPVRLIFDTDMGNDIDDLLALGMIHALQTRGACELLAVTLTKDNALAAPFVDAINHFYGQGAIPVGVVREGVTREEGKFLPLVRAEDASGGPRYPHDLTAEAAPEAVGLLRKVLAEQPDGSVVIAQVGFSTNLARLLETGPDDASPLSGRDLVAKKVKLLSIMAGVFGEPLQGEGPVGEYNVATDLPSAKALVANWPTPIVFSGWEVGDAIRYPAESILEDYAYAPHHPLPEAYILYEPPPHERPCWDLTSVLYGVYPDRGYFGVSAPGRVTVDDQGRTHFAEAPDGPHRFLSVTPEQAVRVREAFAHLASQPPAGSGR